MDNTKTWFDIVRLTLAEDTVSQAPYRVIDIVDANALGTLQDEFDEYGWRDVVAESIDWGDGAFLQWYEWYDSNEKDTEGLVRVYALIRVIGADPLEYELEYEFVKLINLQQVLEMAAETGG